MGKKFLPFALREHVKMGKSLFAVCNILLQILTINHCQKKNSATPHGQLTFWSFEDCRALGTCTTLSLRRLTPHVTSLCTLGSKRHVAVAGGSCDIFIVDVQEKKARNEG